MTKANEQGRPLGLASTAMLGPLPEPDGEFYSWRGQYRVQSKAAYSAETVLRLLAAEREKCAVLCEEQISAAHSGWADGYNEGAQDCANAIRQLGRA